MKLKSIHPRLELQTARLRLRQWQPSDFEPFALMNADPQVMEFFPDPLSRQASDALADKLMQHIAEQGWGVWAVELKSSSDAQGSSTVIPTQALIHGAATAQQQKFFQRSMDSRLRGNDDGEITALAGTGNRIFIGFVGLNVPTTPLPFAPCVEVAWRLARRYWGQGYATEAAREALRVGFEVLELAQIVSFTAVLNRRSQAVMQRLGMQPDAATFEHPSLSVGHPLREHCLYRLSREKWR